MPAKLVAIGDSLTQGVTSGSIYRTEFSYPAMIAQCLGDANFQRPDFTGEGGLPINLENVLRLLVERYGSKVNWHEVIPAALSVRSLLDRVEDYWERGEGNQPSATSSLHHNLAVLSFQLGDCDTLTEAICRRAIPEPKDDIIKQIPEFAMYRAARRTLNPCFDSQKATAQKYGWHVVDISEKLDQLAFRRRQGQVGYLFPQGFIAALRANPNTKHRVSADGQPLLDTRFLGLFPNEIDPLKRFRGGLIGLDGFHPTPACYGLIAHEFLQVMEGAGVAINQPPNWWDEIIHADTLLTNPPPNLEHLHDTLGFLYYRTPLPKLMETFGGRSL